MKGVIGFLVLGYLAVLHGVAVSLWAQARNFYDWNFYGHATYTEWVNYHLDNAITTLVCFAVGAAFVLVGVLLGGKG